MNKRLMLVCVLISLGILMSTGIGQAAYRVDNTAQIVYYSNVLCAFNYSFTDTARIVVLFGPEMYLAKNVRNEVTGDSSATQVPAGRGDTVTFYLYSANNQPNADTSAWHVFVFDTFTSFVQVGAGQSANVGADANANSFTFIAGYETVVYDVEGDMLAPDSVTYFIEGGEGWQGDFNRVTQQLTGTWFTYDADREANLVTHGHSLAAVQGIKYYWRYVPSKQYYDQGTESMAETNLPYKIQLKFSLKKNNN